MNYNIELLEEVVEFILKQSVKMQAKIHRTIQLLKEFGYSLPEPHSKKIKGTKKLFELRVKYGSDICRLFYFHYNDNIYVVVSGYVKKEPKTNKGQIEKAVKLMNHYINICQQ